MSNPLFIIIAGCNDGGKSTSATFLLPNSVHYINADEIAKGLPDNPERNRDMQASRILSNEMARLSRSGENFAAQPRLVAEGSHEVVSNITEMEIWSEITAKGRS
jgi:predicted ABC-type ATPase